MARYAIVDGENVVNVIEYDEEPSNPPPGFDPQIVAVQSDIAGPGWNYINDELVAPYAPAKRKRRRKVSQ